MTLRTGYGIRVLSKSFAVVVVSTGANGDAQKGLVLSEGRALVVREYLVEIFGFDDSHLRTPGRASRQKPTPMPDGVGANRLLSIRGSDAGEQTIASGDFIRDDPRAADSGSWCLST